MFLEALARAVRGFMNCVLGVAIRLSAECRVLNAYEDCLSWRWAGGVVPVDSPPVDPAPLGCYRRCMQWAPLHLTVGPRPLRHGPRPLNRPCTSNPQPNVHPLP